ncbi:MAG TPA: CDC2/CDK family serine/threonine-protein kinase, partial [archaeon]|nr:CDC2/CDK family serine/threonine-protein kinase [archaeon]
MHRPTDGSGGGGGGGGARSGAEAYAEQRQRWGARTVDGYVKIEKIGEGMYGEVYKARSRATEALVALKKVRMDKEKEREGFPITALREIKVLRQLDHPNVVRLLEIVTSPGDPAVDGLGSIYFVFEFMDHDLQGVMDSEHFAALTEAHAKHWMSQLLAAMRFCHDKNILHRDIKASNILLSARGDLKLADFGLARIYSERLRNYTNRVITLWYRPPELLLGHTAYGPEVDIWSCGCILANLLLKRTLFPGKSELDQLDLIFRVCGTPTRESWPEWTSSPWFRDARPATEYPRRFAQTFRDCSPLAVDLLERMLQLDPARRCSAAEALAHPWFQADPLPAAP